ncbi:MFS transporter [Schaalia sp. ZJ1691]|uniref:MFS transporter n=1 Tax=Schaalia sp. ZJ1691 TaxID=2709404 RepID=UPI0013EC837B|nr:MFS transporter [Schaalia sp. ZJ1691]
MPSSPLLTNPTLRALIALAVFTYTAQNMINVSIAPLSRALALPEWIVGGAVSLAAVAVTALSQFWGRRSIAWGRRRVLLTSLVLALIAGTVFSATVWARSAGALGVVAASAGIMLARGPFFGSAIAAIPPTGQALVAEVTQDQTSRVRGMSAFSGAINFSVMFGSLISSALGAVWIFAPVHATPWFIVIALVIALVWVPKDGHSRSPRNTQPTCAPGHSSSSMTVTGELPPRVSWLDRRLLPWIGGVFGMFFANGVVQILMGFIVQDRAHLDPSHAVSITGLMLLTNAAGAMLFQLLIVPKLAWEPRRLLRGGITLGTVAFAALAWAPTLPLVVLSTFLMGVASGLAVPGFSAGASLAVSPEEQGGVAGIMNATGSVTWIFAPVSAAALYGWNPLAPFALGLSLIAFSCTVAWAHPRLRRHATTS